MQVVGQVALQNLGLECQGAFVLRVVCTEDTVGRVPEAELGCSDQKRRRVIPKPVQGDPIALVTR